MGEIKSFRQIWQTTENGLVSEKKEKGNFILVTLSHEYERSQGQMGNKLKTNTGEDR